MKLKPQTNQFEVWTCSDNQLTNERNFDSLEEASTFICEHGISEAIIVPKENQGVFAFYVKDRKTIFSLRLPDGELSHHWEEFKQFVRLYHALQRTASPW